MSNLELGLIGNCCISALVDGHGKIVWNCLPRFDGDPVFHSLLGSKREDGDAKDAGDAGSFSIELDGFETASQHYERNTAILKTRLSGPLGEIEITDFAPRFKWRDRSYRPQMLIRRIRPVSGRPRIRIKLDPSVGYGEKAPDRASGSNHIRYSGNGLRYRLTTDAPIDYLLTDTPFILDEIVNLVFGPDETLSEGAGQIAETYEARTLTYWQQWSHRLALPLEWQEAVIRAAITLKLCSYEPTGGIVAAMTTSIPESAGSGRNWDYRFCWVRDAFFVVRALNSLAAMQTMEHYLRWLMNIVSAERGSTIQPVYGLGLESALTERFAEHLPGYRDMGPVRIGNQAHEHNQHDTYGNIILGAAQAFFDSRLFMQMGRSEFDQLEVMGDQAFALYNVADAGIWELRSRERVHTSSSVMCWAACDRLAKIADHLGIEDRATHWRSRADLIRDYILEGAWSEERESFVESIGGRTLDASVLLMSEVGIIDPLDPRFVSTVKALEATLADGPFMRRYEEADDFGTPEVSFNVCAFWRVDALTRIGEREKAREVFEALLDARNSLGLMSEDSDPRTGEAWGNFPQTYSMVGIVNGAMRLSRPWEGTV